MLEILTALIIIGILVLIISSAFRIFNAKEQLARATEDTLSLVREAREQTLGAVEDDQYGVYFESGRAVLFKGAVFVDGAPENRTVLIDKKVEIFNINAGSQSIIFERLTGGIGVGSSVSLHLKNDSTASTTITVTPSGLIYAE